MGEAEVDEAVAIVQLGEREGGEIIGNAAIEKGTNDFFFGREAGSEAGIKIAKNEMGAVVAEAVGEGSKGLIECAFVVSGCVCLGGVGPSKSGR